MKKASRQGRVALVTGSDRGIGFEVCRRLSERGYRIVLTSPDRKKASAAAARIEGAKVVSHVLDVADPRSVRTVRKYVLAEFKRLDVLVNNAGVLLDEGRSLIEGSIARTLKKAPKKVDFGEGPSVLEQDIDIIRLTLEINTFGALRMCQAFVPLMMEAGYGRVVNVSSGRGQLNGMT
ncbi:MAG: SDR family NAD(P)-dependent oxidoreductase, partial [bacterium]